jgi:hypothetical protein
VAIIDDLRSAAAARLFCPGKICLGHHENPYRLSCCEIVIVEAPRRTLIDIDRVSPSAGRQQISELAARTLSMLAVCILSMANSQIVA